jgi:hypothetical protein
MIAQGRQKEVNTVMYVLAVVFVINFIIAAV